MPGSSCDDNSSHFSTGSGRIGRLLRGKLERDSRKNSQNVGNEVNDINNINGGGSEVLDCDQLGDTSAVENGSVRVPNETDGRPPLERQRLLVVANRLPVSAVRRGEDQWSLEVSAGGLVTALLGN